MCKTQRVGRNKATLECPHGTVFSAKNAQFGAISNMFSSFTWCDQAAIDERMTKEGHKNCTAIMGEKKQ